MEELAGVGQMEEEMEGLAGVGQLGGVARVGQMEGVVEGLSGSPLMLRHPGWRRRLTPCVWCVHALQVCSTSQLVAAQRQCRVRNPK